MMAFIGESEGIIDVHSPDGIDHFAKSPHVGQSIVVDFGADQLPNLLLGQLRAANRVGRIDLDVLAACLRVDLDEGVARDRHHRHFLLMGINGNNLHRISISRIRRSPAKGSHVGPHHQHTKWSPLSQLKLDSP